VTSQVLLGILPTVVVVATVVRVVSSASRRVLVAWIVARKDLAIEREWSATLMQVLKELPAGGEVVDSSGGRSRTIRMGPRRSEAPPAPTSTARAAGPDGQ
jgi:hypothetical protein